MAPSEEKNKTEKIADVNESVEISSRRNIKLGGLLGYLALGINIIFGLFFTPWVIATLGTSNYGVYTLATSIINLFLIDFGLSTTTSVFLSKYRASHDEEAADKFIGVVTKIYLLIDLIILVVFVAAYFLIDYMYAGLSATEKETLRGVFLIVAAFSLISFPSTILTGIINSNEKFIFLKAVDLAVKVSYVGFTTLSLVLGWGIYGLVLSNALTGICGIIIRYLYIHFRLRIRIHLKQKGDSAYLKNIISYSLFAAVASIAARLIFNIMPSVLGVVSNSTEIAVFGIVSTMESYIYMFGGVFFGLFMPKIFRVKEKTNDPGAIERLGIRIGRIQMFFIGLIFCGFTACGLSFLRLWLDTTEIPSSKFLDVYFGILLVSSYQMTYVPACIFDTALMSSKQGIKCCAISRVSAGVINVGLGFLFAWLYGAMGASVSIFIARSLDTIAQYCFYKKYLNVSVKSVIVKVYLSYFLPIIIACAGGLCITLFVPLPEVATFFVSAAFVVIFFGGCSFLFGIEKQDRDKVVRKLKKVFRGGLTK